jgi:glucoamylase
VWAHAEYVKLLRSVADHEIFDLPGAVTRHHADPVAASRRFWRPNHKITDIESGVPLRIELPESATIRWSTDNWTSRIDADTIDSGIGMHYIDIPGSDLPEQGSILFTIRRSTGWEGIDYQISIGGINE